MKTRIKILLGAANVAAVSGFIRICGLEDGLLSAAGDFLEGEAGISANGKRADRRKAA